MDNKNELNDIILNKSAKNNSTKKILLTIATFAIILIIVVVIMNQVSNKSSASLPHAPQTNALATQEVMQEPEPDVVEPKIPVIEKSIEHESELIEDDEDTQEVTTSEIPDGKDETQRIVEEVFEEPVYTTTSKKSPATTPKPVKKATPKQVLKPKPVLPSGKYNPKSKHVVRSTTTSRQYYIQVGSFAKYAPSKTFLDKIANRGYTYTFHKITRSGRTLNKVLVGPFKTQSAAREALPTIKRNVEPGAFLTKI